MRSRLHCGLFQEDANDTAYEWLVNDTGTGWVHWRNQVTAWEYPTGVERPNFAHMLIPTVDSMRYEHLLSLVFSVGKARMPCCLPVVWL